MTNILGSIHLRLDVLSEGTTGQEERPAASLRRGFGLIECLKSHDGHALTVHIRACARLLYRANVKGEREWRELVAVSATLSFE